MRYERNLLSLVNLSWNAPKEVAAVRIAFVFNTEPCDMTSVG